MNKVPSRVDKGAVKENPQDRNTVITDKPATSEAESLEHFLETMARVLGTSKEKLEAILFQGQSVKQKRRNLPTRRPRAGAERSSAVSTDSNLAKT